MIQQQGQKQRRQKLQLVRLVRDEKLAAPQLTDIQITGRDIDNTWAGLLGEKSVHVPKIK